MPSAKIFPLACPDFVTIVESGQYKTEYADEVVGKTLSVLSNKYFDVAILGCTHYPLLGKQIKNNLPNHVKIISSAIETVLDVERKLIERNILAGKETSIAPVFYTTGQKNSFKITVTDWLSIKNPDVRHIDL